MTRLSGRAIRPFWVSSKSVASSNGSSASTASLAAWVEGVASFDCAEAIERESDMAATAKARDWIEVRVISPLLSLRVRCPGAGIGGKAMGPGPASLVGTAARLQKIDRSVKLLRQ
jgi:hypothetical protein